MTDQELTDIELMEQFERATLPAERFHHAEHVRVAFLYLNQYPVLEALHSFSRALQRFAATHGKSKLYHETITWAYIFLIQERMARAGRTQSWEEFVKDNADLLSWKDGVLTRFYREETLRSDLAREIFVFPDKYVERIPKNPIAFSIQSFPYGASHRPDSAERKIASITAMFLTPSPIETGTGPPSRTALEKTSP